MTMFDTPVSNTGRQIARFCADESGATAIEYSIMASGIGIAVSATVSLLGGKVKNLFTALAGMFP